VLEAAGGYVRLYTYDEEGRICPLRWWGVTHSADTAVSGL